MVHPDVRQQIQNRDDGECQDCGRPVGTGRPGEVHHIQPRSRGGTDGPDNLVLLCRSCHGSRHIEKDDAGEGRALLTDREREIISGDADVSDNYRYKVESIVRNRIRKRLGDDVAFLEEEFPEVHELVVDAVCEDGGDDGG